MYHMAVAEMKPNGWKLVHCQILWIISLRKKKQQKDNKFLQEKAGNALARLRAMGE